MLYEKARRLIGWVNGRYEGPVSLDLNITYRCNLQCEFCNGWQYGWTRAGSDRLDGEQCLRIVEEARDLGIRLIHLSGDGEPLVRGDLMLELARLIKGRGIWGGMTTNGSLFGPELIEELVRIGWDHISISLSAGSGELFDDIVGSPGAFEKVTDAIRGIRSARRRLRRLKPGLHINVVLYRRSAGQVPLIMDLASSVGVRSVSFEPIVAFPKIEHLTMDPDEMEAFKMRLPEYRRMARRLGIRTNLDGLAVPGVLERRDLVRGVWSGADKARGTEGNGERGMRGGYDAIGCYQPWLQMVIRPDGAARQCCNFFHPSPDNVLDKSLREIWFGDYFTEVRHQMLRGEMTRECAKCNEWQVREARELRAMLKSRSNRVRHLIGDYGRKAVSAVRLLQRP